MRLYLLRSRTLSSISLVTNATARKGVELSADMVGAGTGFHADQTARNIGKAPLKLLPRGLQLQNDVPALIEADQVERILADIDTNRGDDGCCWLTRHGTCSLCC